jgi:DNA-damage-inducible protein D
VGEKKKKGREEQYGVLMRCVIRYFPTITFLEVYGDMRLDDVFKALDKNRKLTRQGVEYWMGRDIQPLLGYATWENFGNVIKKAMMSCESVGGAVDNHFRETTKMVRIGSGAEGERRDYFLSRYACYLVAMNGDSSKPEVATAQTYFAVQTRRQELEDQLTDDQKRLLLRERVRSVNKQLNGAAKQAGIQNYALFHDAGYRGLYGMGLSDLKQRKGIPSKEDLLDCAGREELAANEFRITQAEARLNREQIRGQRAAEDTHLTVGKEVRTTIAKLGGTMPEDLPREQNIKQLTSRKAVKALLADEVKDNNSESE